MDLDFGGCSRQSLTLPLVTCSGPNSGLGTGNLLIILEGMADYVAKSVQKMQSQAIQSMQPSLPAMSRFIRHCDEFFERTVFSESCSSWYKTDGRVTALWPGSSLHAIKALEHPRWEDWEYSYVNGDEMCWFGDGSTEADWSSELDKSTYLTSHELVEDDLRQDTGGLRGTLNGEPRHRL